ncbi:IclR family transcriptional regulator C-terminal domain-containing protein [Citricoccus nitrophenolicus]|uniref:IclR family transcriptional regulator domain-containing protein n=1 Tax=Citricoccus nitrophenolicus TaxID=863575 RepID=UPI0039B41FF0
MGTQLPLYASPTGQALLSALSEDELAEYLSAAPFPERAPHDTRHAVPLQPNTRSCGTQPAHISHGSWLVRDRLADWCRTCRA